VRTLLEHHFALEKAFPVKTRRAQDIVRAVANRAGITRDGVPIAVRREKARIFSGCKSRPDNWSLHPVAIGAAAEVTKPSKPSRQRAALAARRAGRPQRE
jgi:hypothetical protein